MWWNQQISFINQVKSSGLLARGNGVWETGENYDSKKLYVGFKDKCHKISDPSINPVFYHI